MSLPQRIRFENIKGNVMNFGSIPSAGLASLVSKCCHHSLWTENVKQVNLLLEKFKIETTV